MSPKGRLNPLEGDEVSAMNHAYQIDASMYWLFNQKNETSCTLLLLFDLVDERPHAVGEVDPELVAVLQQGTGLGGPSDAGWGPGDVSASTACGCRCANGIREAAGGSHGSPSDDECSSGEGGALR